MRITAVVNQKGGSGKTTTAINLAAVYARRGLRTLLVDIDPQAHCSAGLGVPDGQVEMSVGEAMLSDLGPGFDPTPLLWEVARNFHLAPSTMRLAALESPAGGLYQMADRDRRLATLLKILSPRFDRCIIDCPPTIGLLTYNALRAAREALIPVETGFFSLRGAEKQWTTICRLIERLDRPIAVHILPTIHRQNSRLACEILGSLRKRFAGQIVPMEIEEHDALRESASFGQPVMEYAPGSTAHKQFEQLVDWLEDHMPTTGVEIEVMRTLDAPAGSLGNAVDGNGGSTPAPFGDASPHAFGDPYSQPARGDVLPCLPADARPVGARAAEMALKVRSLVQARREDASEGSAAMTVSAPPAHVRKMRETAAPTVAIERRPCVVLEAPPERKPAESHALSTAPPTAGSIESVYGVRQVHDGVLFVQPGAIGQRVCVAGDFNGWSADATPLAFDSVLKVHHAIVHIPAGRHRYRLVVDGSWVNDQYNPAREQNDFGEPNSIIEVTEERRQS